MSAWVQDFRYSARVLAKAPAFTLVAVAALALGIGVNAAALSVARAVLLQPLPVPAPDRLVVAHWVGQGVAVTNEINSGDIRHPRTGEWTNSNYSYPAYLALRDALREHADVFSFTFIRAANVSAHGRPVVAGGMLVDGSYFRALGVPIALGRGLTDDDDSPEAPPVAVIGHGLWRRAFAEDPAAIGQTIKVNGVSFTVVGVTAREYFGVSNGGFFPPAEITLPLRAQPLVHPHWTPETGSLFDADAVLWLRLMARLRPGVDARALSPAATIAFERHLAGRRAPAVGEARGLEVVLVPGARGMESMRTAMQKPIYMLGGVALLVFLIACISLANLMLSRGLARQQEFRVRLALGAGRGRLVRQAVAESLLIAAAGGVAGTLLAAWSGRVLLATMAGSTPTALDVRLDPWLIGVAALISLIAAALFGLIPAWRLSSQAASELIRQTGAGAPRLRAGRALVFVQVAVSVPLLVGAVLFLRTIYNLSSVSLGFEPRGVIVFKMDPALNGYEEPKIKDLYTRVLDRLQAEPGIQSATLVENALVSGWVSRTRITVDGGAPMQLSINRVGPAFFETLGLPVIAGRGIGPRDRDGAPLVGIVNEAAVAKVFGGRSPLGRSVQVGGGAMGARVEIVGVVRDSKYSSLKREGGPVLFLPYFQSKRMTAMFVAVRGGTSAALADRIRAAVAEVDAEVPVTALKTQLQQIEETIGNERAFTSLLLFFGTFALLLAAIGLHGVTSYAVTRRTGEIGIRLALGARPQQVLWLILRQVVGLAVCGLVAGLALAGLLSRSIQAFLYEVTPADPWSLTAGAVILFLTAMLAGYLPARAAARLDPLVALRRE
jgi:predicted permease